MTQTNILNTSDTSDPTHHMSALTAISGERTPDCEARAHNLYDVRILRCAGGRSVEIEEAGGVRQVVDCATNSPFGLNIRPELVLGAINAISRYGAVHSSVAAARAQTGLVEAIADRLIAMKGPGAAARVYPTTLSANVAAAAGFAGRDATAIVHPNAHATVQSAVDAVFDNGRVIRTKNTTEVARAFALTTRRPVVLVEDGLYSMGCFADFAAIKAFLSQHPSAWVWLDDAHSFGMRGRDGRGEAMEQLADFPAQTVVTGSFGKAVGAAGGFLVASAVFVEQMLRDSVSDRFSCNLDLAAQGATLAALELLAAPNNLCELQGALQERVQCLDDALALVGITTEQAGTPIAFRVVPFAGPSEAITAASRLLRAGFLTTPVYFPTVARRKGAIRIAISAAHTPGEISSLIAALLPHVGIQGRAA